MLQDIAPHIFDNHYEARCPVAADRLIIVKDHQVLMRLDKGALELPTYGELLGFADSLASAALRESAPSVDSTDPLEVTAPSPVETRFLFSIDEVGFFLASRDQERVKDFLEAHEGRDYQFYGARDLLAYASPFAFAGVTALQLARWYRTNTYCGVCATPLEHSSTERALSCPRCGHVEYPKIAPVVIVGIINGDELLLTKSALGEYKLYGLVAGFVEVGETLEQACEREVMEEVGLSIKNIRYYKTQPWSLTDSLLVGFYADVAGDPTVRLDEVELSEATWFARNDIPADNTNPMSLTGSMIGAFKEGS